MCNAYRLHDWCSNLHCTCAGSQNFASTTSFCCASVPICRHSLASCATLRSAIRAQIPNKEMPDAVYNLKQLKLPWDDNEAVVTIRLAPDSIASARGVAALVGGGPAPYGRWAREKNQQMKLRWTGPDNWKRGTCHTDERAIVYRTLRYPPDVRDQNPSLLDKTRPTQVLDVFCLQGFAHILGSSGLSLQFRLV